MKIVKPSVNLMGVMMPFDGLDANWNLCGNFGLWPENLIEQAGRTCYKSEDKITEDSHKQFIEMVVKRGHESVLEHSCASFRIVCDRGVSHEIVRHRLVSYSQESTRYCNYGKEKFGEEITVIEPPFDFASYHDTCVREWWVDSCAEAERAYLVMIKAGVPAQLARSVLPTCLKTEIVMTCNFREWKHFLKLRTAPAAHPQMREIALMIKAILVKIAPTVFKEPVPECSTTTNGSVLKK